MIPQKTVSHLAHQYNHDPIVLSTPFVVLLLPLVIGIYVTQHKKHRKRVLKQQIDQLEQLWNKKTDREYS